MFTKIISEKTYWRLMLILLCTMVVHLPIVAFLEFEEGVNKPDNVPTLVMATFFTSCTLLILWLLAIDAVKKQWNPTAD